MHVYVFPMKDQTENRGIIKWFGKNISLINIPWPGPGDTLIFPGQAPTDSDISRYISFITIPQSTLPSIARYKTQGG